jgi:hypothetical protein
MLSNLDVWAEAVMAEKAGDLGSLGSFFDMLGKVCDELLCMLLISQLRLCTSISVWHFQNIQCSKVRDTVCLLSL